ncbi:MAG TPA: CHAT domain-containing protein [Thermoanaerobaculia bacterium]|nr:CHAT domain-containing protein [Thermoanaerobaculia bacterium]
MASTRTETPDEITAGGAPDRADSYDEYESESARSESRDEVGAGESRDRLYSDASYEAEPSADLEEEPTVASEATPGATRIEHVPEIRTEDSHGILMVKLPPDPERDPPRSAFALLECPEAVVAEREFALTVGLAPKPMAGVVSARIARPEWSVGPYTLTTQLVAEGFALRDDESWRQDMRVTADEPYPAITLHLTPEAQEAGIHARIIRAHYSVDGQVIGVAYRSIAVARDDELLAEASVEPQEAGVDLSVPTDRVPADLTLMIQRSKLAKGRLLWNLQTAFKDIRVPEKALPVEVGDEPEAFARQLANQVNLREGRAGIYPLLLGVARTIAGPIPDEFWEVLTKVSARARAQSRAVTVLILSEEPYIPWELAAVEPPIDPDAPPFLGAQANVGRWVLAKKGPKLPPPAQVNVGPMAVVFGVYKTPWQRLLEAEDEAAKLKDTYGAVGVDATIDPVLNCISGTPEADILHFAVHGMYDADAALLDGLILVDGNPVAPLQVKGSALRRGPFVFLNACQVGRGNRILGDYAGMAEAFLFAGAAALVAPLWSVKDDVAKRIALDFYEKTFAGATPADVLRRERAKFKPSLGPEFATYLAYQFFGHPTMKLTRRN